jgi:hypothetical protein
LHPERGGLWLHHISPTFTIELSSASSITVRIL